MEPPPISPWLLRWFRWYSRRYLARHFHAVRAVGSRFGVQDLAGPLVIYMNHPVWWDPLVGCLLAERLFPGRRHYAPIEQKALDRYRFMEHLGLFGVEPLSRRSLARFLRIALAILQRSDSVLWITPQGRFADPRERPLRFKPGLAHLAARLKSGTLLPLAVEYPFWQERTPEVLVLFGDPIPITHPVDRPIEQWTPVLESRLEETMDQLADAAIRQNQADFEVLLSGKAGVGGVYDVWRWFKATWRGERFLPEHRQSGS